MASMYKEKAVAALRKTGSWLYALAATRSWKSWVLLAAAAILCILMWMLALDSVDYQSDPSALVPRSAFFYGETTDVRKLLANASARKIWREAPPEQAVDGQWSRLEMDIADIVSSQVDGLARIQPLSWLAGSGKAAVAFLAGDDGVESWALYLDCAQNGAAVLDQIKVERGLELTAAPADKQKGGTVYRLTGADASGALYLSHIAPWLVVSSGETLPTCAVGRDAGYSMANSRVLPEWRYNSTLRGVFNPSHFALAGAGQDSRLALLGQLLSPEARIGFTGGLPASGDIALRYSNATLASTPGGDGLWPIFKVLFGLLGIILLVFFLSIVATMLGWGAWLKLLAVKAGIVPSEKPKEAVASAAFRQDSGAGAPVPSSVSEISAASRGADVVAVETAVSGAEDAADTVVESAAASDTRGDGETSGTEMDTDSDTSGGN